MALRKRKYFVFNFEWRKILMNYTPEVRLEVYDAIIEYALSGKILNMKRLSNMAFSFIKKEIDCNNARYRETCNKRSEAGKRHSGNQYTTNGANGANGAICCENGTNGTNGTDNDIDNDNIKEISLSGDEEKDPPSEVLDKTLGECHDELSGDRGWVEIVVMNTRNSGHKDFTVGMFGKYLKRFFEKLQNEGEVRKSPKDAKSHFARWLNIELNKKANHESRPITNIYEQKRIDSEQRKLRLMAEFAEADARFLAEQEARRKAVGPIGEIPDPLPNGG